MNEILLAENFWKKWKFCQAFWKWILSYLLFVSFANAAVLWFSARLSWDQYTWLSDKTSCQPRTFSNYKCDQTTEEKVLLNKKMFIKIGLREHESLVSHFSCFCYVCTKRYCKDLLDLQRMRMSCQICISSDWVADSDEEVLQDMGQMHDRWSISALRRLQKYE